VLVKGPLGFIGYFGGKCYGIRKREAKYLKLKLQIEENCMIITSKGGEPCHENYLDS